VGHDRGPTDLGAPWLSGNPGGAAADPRQALERVFREEYGRILAGLIGQFRDFDVAEEAMQEAQLTALERWPDDGVPSNPGAWIATAARRKAIDRLRRARRYSEKQVELARDPTVAGSAEELKPSGEEVETPMLADDRLRLIFTCCHPALAPEARIALTLRTLGGLTTPEIARAFLVPEPTLAQRLVRAK
jgi:RNA polymerase sigma-70 factor (ECF subfamily)